MTTVDALPPSRPVTLVERTGPIPGWGPLVPFLAISAQLAALLFALRLFEIEPGTGLLRILPLIFIGFVVHAALPMKLRMPFFLLLTFGAIGMVLGPVAGILLVVIGVVMVGVCHLPLPFSIRVLLQVLIAGVLAALRTGWIKVPAALLSSLSLPALPRMILPVLASMFMFRMIIYMYDLRHAERARAEGKPVRGIAGQPASIWTRLSYFFLLPNVCFLLFPIVDYPTFRRTYYDSDAQSIYQKGVWWICLGLIQLLLYRLVYHYLIPSPEDVQGLGGIVRFMLAAYLIYFRVVGQFQIIIGILCLFGFNLPPAHRFYLLASSFTDFWRRARIEWKDFMVKVFYYPALVPLQRKMGATPALIVATIWVFVITWLLHGYQWFWLIGDFRLLGNDGVFWTIIGSCVLVNSLLEARKARARASARWETGRAFLHASKVVGMFAFMCVLWSYWSSPSYALWASYLTAAQESGPLSWALLVGSLLAVVMLGVLAQYIAFKRAEARTLKAKAAPAPKTRVPQPAAPGVFGWRAAAVTATAIVLLITGLPKSRQALGSSAAEVATTVSTNSLNAVDQEREDRGYYEELLDTPRSTAALAASPGDIKDANAAKDSTDTPSDEGDPDAGAVAPPAKDSTPAPQPDPAPDPAPTASAPSPRGGLTLAGSSAESGMIALEEFARVGSPVIPSVRRQLMRDVSLASWTDEPSAFARSNALVFRRQGVVGRRLRPYEQVTRDMTMWANAPNYVGSLKGAPVRMNQWGMRDKDYSLVAPPRTYRMALLGTSMTFGAGVPVEETMESLLEDRLNREGPGAPRRHYEILNFSVGGYGIMQNVAVLDNKVFPFKPNAVLVGVFSVDATRMTDYVAKLVRSGIPIPYPALQEKLKATGATANMERPELLRRLGPISEDLVQWSYHHIVEVCQRHGIPAIGIVLPEPRMKAGHDIDQAARLASAAGLPLLDLRGVYGNMPADSFRLAGENDPHWNARGHKLIADRIYTLLRDKDARGFNLGAMK